MEKSDCVGIAGMMPGTEGFTMAAFLAADVPVGTPLYTRPKWQTGVPPVAKGECLEFIVARRLNYNGAVVVTAAVYANEHSDELTDRDGNDFVADGWYLVGPDPSRDFNEFFEPLLSPGDEVLGWQELPKWESV